MGQMATQLNQALSQNSDKLPSQTVQNPKNVSAITLRSGKQIQVPPPVAAPAPEPIKLYSIPKKEDEIIAQKRKLPNKNFHAAEDEFFRLTTKEGKLTVERDVVRTKTADFSPILQFEQDPVQILDALLPLYLNSQVLRALQESLASELAARMSAMSNATDNAIELKKNLSIVYNRERQAKITGEILEIVAGANALQ